MFENEAVVWCNLQVSFFFTCIMLLDAQSLTNSTLYEAFLSDLQKNFIDAIVRTRLL